MVEKKQTENKSATANANNNAVIQKNKTDSKETKPSKAKFSEMKKDEASVKPDVEETHLPVSNFPMTLEEFCTRLSQDKNQVELIGGFYAHEKIASEKSPGEKTVQHLMDTEVNFKARFDDFCQLPVES